MKLAEAIRERVPSCERVRFMNSGTEATSTAVRLARGYTGRDRVVIFHGNFHGATDALLAAVEVASPRWVFREPLACRQVPSAKRWWCPTTLCHNLMKPLRGHCRTGCGEYGCRRAGPRIP